MEREADRVGMGILVQAGFEPQGFVTLFEKLQQASRLNDSGAFPYLRTHPLTTERIADMQARLPQGGPAAVGAAPHRLHHLVAARSRVLSQAQVDALRARVVEAQPALAASSTAPGAADGSVSDGALYAAALASLKLRDFAAADRFAQALAERVRNDEPAARLALLLRAEIALQTLQAAPAAPGTAAPPAAPATPAAATKAAADLKALMAQWPLPGDATQAARAHWLLWSQAWLATGQTDLAAARLQTWVALHPRDATAWQLLASVQQQRGQVLRAIRAEAEAQVARQDLPAALDRLRAAQDWIRRSPSAGGAAVDHIEASIIDTRAREVAALLREQALER
jgi:predicted Zn-dependent protease